MTFNYSFDIKKNLKDYLRQLKYSYHSRYIASIMMVLLVLDGILITFFNNGAPLIIPFLESNTWLYWGCLGIICLLGTNIITFNLWKKKIIHRPSKLLHSQIIAIPILYIYIALIIMTNMRAISLWIQALLIITVVVLKAGLIRFDFREEASNLNI